MYRGVSDNLIVVTNRKLCSIPFLAQIEKLCAMGFRRIILREKDLKEADYYELAEQVLGICRKYRIECILHTYPEVARALRADGIHLPLHIAKTCKERGENLKKEFAEVGISVHSLEQAKEAVECGATYLTAGHIYETDCKRGIAPRGIEFLQELCAEIAIPVYAIGGINWSNLEAVQRAGAAGGCMMSGLMKS